jgi:lipopolysaccharide/colanic/teichoic acid biosynthesis glycosyltransferase
MRSAGSSDASHARTDAGGPLSANLTSSGTRLSAMTPPRGLLEDPAVSPPSVGTLETSRALETSSPDSRAWQQVAPRARSKTPWLVAKRMVDVTVAAVLLVALSPLLLLIALLIRATSPGPAVFRQRRCGVGAHPFTVYKFRTMWASASPETHESFIADLVGGSEPTTLKKLTADPRVTPVGRILRRASLDELPQLLNVLEGSMSLVGPRPIPPYELRYYRPEDFDRFSVRPGITGLWQVSGRSRLGFYEMLDLDASYARRCSLRLDLAILLRTPRALFAKATA